MSVAASTLTLIVVDDDLDIRRAVGRSLRSHGYEVYLFESGEECLAQDRDADCAIVDIGLPGSTGSRWKNSCGHAVVPCPSSLLPRMTTSPVARD